jgi:hypothetical protein
VTAEWNFVCASYSRTDKRVNRVGPTLTGRISELMVIQMICLRMLRNTMVPRMPHKRQLHRC